jgi:hypothetical protein
VITFAIAFFSKQRIFEFLSKKDFMALLVIVKGLKNLRKEASIMVLAMFL